MKPIIQGMFTGAAVALCICAISIPKKCTKVHLKPWEYRVTIDGTDSILKYTFVTDQSDTIVKDICAHDLDYELTLEEY